MSEKCKKQKFECPKNVKKKKSLNNVRKKAEDFKKMERCLKKKKKKI